MDFKRNLIFVGSLVLIAVVLGFFLMDQESKAKILSFVSQKESVEAVAKKSVDYLNSNVLQDGRKANLVGFSEESGIIKMNIKIGESSYTSYVTRDGKILFPEGIKITSGSVQNQQNNQSGLEKVRAVSQEDHIRGSMDSKVFIVEYSDLECPFCKQFHVTLKQVMNEYSKDNRVAWVYRHFPLDQLHSKARKEAVASECAFEQGGNNSFWNFIDRFYEITPSNNQTNLDVVLPQIAREMGLDQNNFNTCLSSGSYDAKVQNDVTNATETGGSGTPWSIVVAKSGKKYALSGSQSYDSVKQLIDTALAD